MARILPCKFIGQLFIRSGEEVLAWSSVQIICQCTVSESRVQLPRENILLAEEASTTGCDTSFVPNKGEAGFLEKYTNSLGHF